LLCMKKIVVILTTLAILFIAPTAVAQDDSDKNFRKEEIVSVAKGEVIEGDFFAFGERVEISGTVNGDVYTAGGDILVDGDVNGDLLAVGGNISISGNISQDVRVAGGQVRISGKIGNNITIGAGNVDITQDAKIGGSIVAGAGNISLAAPISGDVRIGAGNLTISSKIGGNVNVGVGEIRLTSNAKVEGDLTYWSDGDVSIDESAVVAGAVTKNPPPDFSKPSPTKIFGVFTGFTLVTAFISLTSTFVIGLLLINLFPRFNRGVVLTLRKKPWISLGVGVLALIATPIVFGLLMATVVGLPLGLILMALYFILLYLARIFVIFWIGISLFERSGRKAHEVWALIIGLVVYYIITLVPIIGGIVTLSVLLFGLGAAILTKKELYLAARKKELL